MEEVSWKEWSKRMKSLPIIKVTQWAMSKAVKSNPSNKEDYLDIERQVIKVLNTEKNY